MNRQQRRAMARGKHPGLERRLKQSHRLPAERCALYVPEAGSYVADFSANRLSLVESIDLARPYTDDAATTAALSFRQVTGLRVAVRPLHGTR